MFVGAISPFSAFGRFIPLFSKEGSYVKDDIIMKKIQIHNKNELLESRRALRKNLTPAEAFLWKELKAKQLDGKKFAKQHSIGNYIVDFYLASDKLIIELDGEVHQNPATAEYDQKRTDYLKSEGFTVIRFENKMVFDNLTSVLMEIKENFKENKI
jgi:very-short-patch-repair endonuclease